MLKWSIEAFENAAPQAEIIVALSREWDVSPHKACAGGTTRSESVRNALATLSTDCELIAVHDAARPLVTPQLIKRVVQLALKKGSAIPVVPLVDSIRRVEGGAEDRDTLLAVQTPQIFRADILREAYEKSTENYSDDATLVEAMGYKITLCEGERRNIKITEPIDFQIAETILKNDRNQVQISTR